jgi:hypothetical protein
MCESPMSGSAVAVRSGWGSRGDSEGRKEIAPAGSELDSSLSIRHLVAQSRVRRHTRKCRFGWLRGGNLPFFVRFRYRRCTGQVEPVACFHPVHRGGWAFDLTRPPALKKDNGDHSASRSGPIRNRGLCVDRNGDSRCGLTESVLSRLRATASIAAHTARQFAALGSGRRCRRTVQPLCESLCKLSQAATHH